MYSGQEKNGNLGLGQAQNLIEGKGLGGKRRPRNKS